jgi:diguanylate cyclase (GGDEF)-like protein/PAS domain S-box-containing protein
MRIRVVMLEDRGPDAEQALRALRQSGMEVQARVVDSEVSFRSALREFSPDAIIADFGMPAFDGSRALQLAREQAPYVPFIFVSGALGEEPAVDALKRGATDYVLKSSLHRLAASVKRAVQEAKERRAREEAEKRLQHTERMLELFLRHLPGGAYIKDLSGRYLVVNDAFEKTLRKRREEILGRTALELHPESLGRQIMANDQAVIRGGKNVQVTEVLRQADGDHTYLVHKFPIRDENGSLTLLGGISLDITDRIQQQKKLARLLRIRELTSEVNAAIARTRDRATLLTELCRTAVEVGGMKAAWAALLDREGRHLEPVAMSGAINMSLEELRTLLRNATLETVSLPVLAVMRGEMVVDNDIANSALGASWKARCLGNGFRSGISAPLFSRGRLTGTFTLYSGEPHYFDSDELWLFKDLAADIHLALENIERQEQLDYLAYFDAMTGIANRTLFLDRVNRLLGEARRTHTRTALVLLDVERMRYINDSFGRSAGDSLLRQLAARLSGQFGEETIARIGLDTFAVCFPGLTTAVEAGSVVAAAFSGFFTPEFEVGGKNHPLSAKYGVALFPEDSDQAEKLLECAETALKTAKTRAQTMVFYTPRLNADVAERMALETRLRRAVERREFVLHYQPKLSVEDGQLDGVEALLRWNDPVGGLTLPAKFISVLEENGLIVEVGRWALEEAAAAHGRWQSEGLSAPRVAVNISAAQLQNERFARELVDGASVHAAHGIDLEITESMVIHDLDRSMKLLSALRGSGVRVAMDDFGTGYSSLSYLARLPLDYLKVDRSFVDGLETNADHAAIVLAITTLAHSLRLKVVAEGVETEQQLKRLRELRCDQIQGFLIGRPVPEQQIARMLRG